MKKKLVSICVIVLVLVLALFALSACNDGRTAVDTELVSNRGFEDFNRNDDGKVYFDEWKISYSEDVDEPYKRQSISSDDSLYEDHGSGYVILTTDDESGWVFLSQEIAVDRNAVYRVTVDVRVPSLSKGDDSTFRGAYVTFLENTDYIFGKKETTTNDWETVTFYVRPLNTDYLTLTLALGADGEECEGTAYFDNVSVMRVDPSSVPDGSTVYDFRMSQIARYNRDLSGTLFVSLLTVFGVVVLVCAYVIVRKAYAKSDVFVNFDGSASSPVASISGSGSWMSRAVSSNRFLVSRSFCAWACAGSFQAMFPSRFFSRWPRAVLNSSPMSPSRSSQVRKVYFSLSLWVLAWEARFCTSA